MGRIATEDITFEDIADHIEVGSSVYSSPEVVDPTHVIWKHLDNPFGASISVSLRNEAGRLVGHSFLQPRRFCTSGGKAVAAATITDLVIVPSERNAAALIGMTKMAKGEKRFDVVLHTSNQISDVIYRKLFKFPVAFSLVASVLPLRIERALSTHISADWLRECLDLLVAPWRWMVKGAAVLAGAVGGVSFGVEPTPDVIDVIHKEFKAHVGSHFERSEAYLEWRFRKGPIFRGQLLWVWSAGECLGYVAVRKVSIKGVDVLVILDSVLRRPVGILESIAIKLLCASEAVRARCDLVFCLANRENVALRWWSQPPFIRVRDKYLPHPTPIFVHAKGCVDASDIQSNMFLTLADLDYF